MSRNVIAIYFRRLSWFYFFSYMAIPVYIGVSQYEQYQMKILSFLNKNSMFLNLYKIFAFIRACKPLSSELISSNGGFQQQKNRFCTSAQNLLHNNQHSQNMWAQVCASGRILSKCSWVFVTAAGRDADKNCWKKKAFSEGVGPSCICRCGFEHFFYFVLNTSFFPCK